MSVRFLSAWPMIACLPGGLAEGSGLDEIWKLPVLYSNPRSPALREFSLAGNLQWQWAAGDGNRGAFGTRDRPEEVRWGDVEIRRMELGFRAKIGDSWKLQGKIDGNPTGELDPAADQTLGHGFYRDLHDLSLVYVPSPAFNLGIGKITPKFFTLENYTSSSELIVFERSLLVETLIPKELTGIWMNGRKDAWIYALAGYAGDYRPEFPEFDAGFVTQASLGYDFGPEWGLGEAVFKLDYQYSSSAENTGGPGRFGHAFSFNCSIKEGPWSLYGDILAGVGRRGQGDVGGITVAPSFRVTEDIELILRYQHANGSDDGLRLSSRYERLAPGLAGGGMGGTFDACYLGLIYYIHGHGLKLMAGAEYQHMDGGTGGSDYSGVTSLAGLRMSF